MIPLLIGLPGFLADLFTRTALQSLTVAVGTFIHLDPGVAVLNYPSYACVCVEVNLLEPLHCMILIHNGDEIFSQPMIYEWLTQFCTRCTILGHTLQTYKSVTNSVEHVPFRNALVLLSYDEYIVDLGTRVGNIRPRASPQTSTWIVANVKMQMEPPPQPSAKVVIPLRWSHLPLPIRGRRKRLSALFSPILQGMLLYNLSKYQTILMCW